MERDDGPNTGGILREREKELACIYSICLLAAGAPEPREAAKGIARALCAAMMHPAAAGCAVRFFHESDGQEILERRGRLAPEGRAGVPRIESPLPDTADGWTGTIRIEYAAGGPEFLPQERSLLESVLVVAASILRTASLFRELRVMADDLSSKNAALREILSHIEDERRRALDSMRAWIDSELLPLAERVLDPGIGPEKRNAYADLVVAEARRFSSGFGPRPNEPPSLSPREREVAAQVRNGRTSKEIASLLGISIATVERHRHNIRSKLKLSGSDANLAGFLSSMS